MKKTFILAILATLLVSINCKSQNTSHFKNLAEAESFFLKFDDLYNDAMVKADSIWFIKNISENYINCTPQGDLKNKKEEIKTLVWLSTLLAKVERVSPETKIFTYSGNVATLSVVKKLIHKNSFVSYVRRTNIYQFLDGKWSNVAGQGTMVPNEKIEVKKQ